MMSAANQSLTSLTSKQGKKKLQPAVQSKYIFQQRLSPTLVGFTLSVGVVNWSPPDSIDKKKDEKTENVIELCFCIKGSPHNCIFQSFNLIIFFQA